MTWKHNFTRRNQIQQRENRRKKQTRTPNQHQNPENRFLGQSNTSQSSYPTSLKKQTT